MLNFLGSAQSVFSMILYVLLALVVLLIMILIHETGHYVAGKIFKFKINEFSIGFGKAIFQKTKKNGEVFSVRLVPLGGYCAFEGEDEDGESEDSFNKQAWWKRVIVLFSGAFFNFLSAIIFSVVLLSVVGSGYTDLTTVDVQPTQYVIESETLQVGDTITKVNGTKCTFLNGAFNGMVSAVQNDKDVITLTIERVENGKRVSKDIQVTKVAVDKDGNYTTIEDDIVDYKIGVTTKWHNYNFGEALLRAVPFTFSLAWEVLLILGKLLTGNLGLNQVGGPITTIKSIATASQQSLLNLILLFPLIAVNLAVFNLLPIPALDGARIVFVLIEAIRRKPINRDLEAKIHFVGLVVLFAFVILVDILQIFVFR